MNSAYDIRVCDADDMRFIVRHAAQEDVDECKALYGPEVNFGVRVRQSWLSSRDTTFVATAYLHPVAMFGLKTPGLLNDTAIPWMIATDELKQYWRPFLRGSKQIVKLWSDQYPIMENYVSAHHTVAVKWLHWLGFVLYCAKPFGLVGSPFHRFEMRRENV